MPAAGGIALGVHNHQPVGNFGHVIEQAFEQAYGPFLDTLERFPNVKMNFHTSGPLLEWMKSARPEYIKRLGQLAQSGQVEIVGGAYWEPILSVLPEADQRAQIKRMQLEIEQLFAVKARGFWLAERIWEPHLPRVLAEEGVDYVMLDDSHFLGAGFSPDSLHDYYLSEEGGRSVAIFPISRELRYLIPFRPIEELEKHLDQLPEEGLGVLFDDGEKFGLWRGTHDHCYGEGYLKRLFDFLSQREDRPTCLFSEWLDARPAAGSAYLPTGSYQEMGEWSLPAKAAERFNGLSERLGESPEKSPFLRGGFWRNFFVKYPESHWMHKRMLLASRRCDEVTNRPMALREQARDQVLQSQCNCAYWHGLFGGLYLPHLPQAVFERIVRAEAIVHPAAYRIEELDMDMDGHQEIFWSSPHAQLFLKPDDGGSVREIDFLEKPFPLSNVLSRRREFYHRHVAEALSPDEDSSLSIHDVKSAKEKGLEKLLIYDPYTRAGLEERFFEAGVEAAPYDGGLFDTRAWRFKAELPDSPDDELILRGCRRDLKIEKRLAWEDEGRTLRVAYLLEYIGETEKNLTFASGWNFNFLAPEAHDRRFRADGKDLAEPQLRSRGWADPASQFELRDEWAGLSVFLEGRDLRIWREPIETVSMSEDGFERVYQGSWIAVCTSVTLAKGNPLQFEYRLRMEKH